MRVDLTIIIPFYKTIQYITDLLDSIVNQREDILNRIQILLINDGDINKIEAVIPKYNNLPISYHRKPNGNWGSVINYVKNNNLIYGRYVTIIDSDDRYQEDAIFTFLKSIDSYSPDLIISNFYLGNAPHKTKDCHVLHMTSNRIKRIDVNTNRLLRTPYSFPLGKIYKTDIFMNTPDLKENVFYQDVNLYYYCMLKSKNVFYINKNLSYHRENRPDSSSNISGNDDRIAQGIDVIKFLDKMDSTIISIWYATISGFKKKFIGLNHNPIKLTNKIQRCYLTRKTFGLALIIFKIKLTFSKKLFV